MLILIGYPCISFLIAKNCNSKTNIVTVNYFGGINDTEIKNNRIKADITIDSNYKIKTNVITQETDIKDGNSFNVIYWGKINRMKGSNIIFIHDVYLINKVISDRMYLGCTECFIIGLILVREIETRVYIEKIVVIKEASLIFAPFRIYQYSLSDIKYKFMNVADTCTFYKIQFEDDTTNGINMIEFVKKAHLLFNDKVKNIVDKKDGVWFYYEHKLNYESVKKIKDITDIGLKYRSVWSVLRMNIFDDVHKYSIIDIANKVLFCIDNVYYNEGVRKSLYQNYANFSKYLAIKKVIEDNQVKYYIVNGPSVIKNKNLDFTDTVQTAIEIQTNDLEKNVLLSLYHTIKSNSGYLDKNEIAELYYYPLNKSMDLLVIKFHKQNTVIHFRIHKTMSNIYYVFHVKEILLLKDKNKNTINVIVLSTPHVGNVHYDFFNTIFYFLASYGIDSVIKEVYYNDYVLIDECYINIEFLKTDKFLKKDKSFISKEPYYIKLDSFTYFKNDVETFLIANVCKEFYLDDSDFISNIREEYSQNYKDNVILIDSPGQSYTYENILAVVKSEKENVLNKIFQRKAKYSINILCRLHETWEYTLVDNSVNKNVANIEGYFKIYIKDTDYKYEDNIENIEDEFLPTIYVYLISEYYGDITIYSSS